MVRIRCLGSEVLGVDSGHRRERAQHSDQMRFAADGVHVENEVAMHGEAHSDHPEPAWGDKGYRLVVEQPTGGVSDGGWGSERMGRQDSARRP